MINSNYLTELSLHAIFPFEWTKNTVDQQIAVFEHFEFALRKIKVTIRANSQV